MSSNRPNSGLQPLQGLRQLLIKHHCDPVVDILTDFDAENTYSVKNNQGKKLYFAAEHSDDIGRNFLKRIRSFDICLYDKYAMEVMKFSHRTKWCAQEMVVSITPGFVCGKIVQKRLCCHPVFLVKDYEGKVVLKIEGPCCALHCFKNIIFNIVNPSGMIVGRLDMKESSYSKNSFLAGEYFGICFPAELTSEIKAMLLGAGFLIYVMYFEH